MNHMLKRESKIFKFDFQYALDRRLLKLKLYIEIKGLLVTRSGIFSAPGTFLAIKKGLRASIAFGSS